MPCLCGEIVIFFVNGLNTGGKHLRGFVRAALRMELSGNQKLVAPYCLAPVAPDDINTLAKKEEDYELV